MLRSMLWTLRQPRYATLAAVMVLLALACVGAGTFELHRFHEKRHDNGVLKANDHAAAVALSTELLPVTGQGSAPDPLDVRYRTVTARGVWDTGDEQYLGNESQGGRPGFVVLTPLRTPGGTLLVARGFLAAASDGNRPREVPPPAAGTVNVRGRVYTGSGADDRAGRLPAQEITAVNPVRQARRLGTPVYQGYVTLADGQAGVTGLDPLPGPSLSNPTGGAGELQLLSYVVQWYVFALLALLAPFAFARADAKEARRRFLGLDDDDVEFDLAARAAAGTDQRAALDAGSPPPDPDAAAGELAVRAGAELARAGSDAQWQAAERLADRYGRSLGPRPEADRTVRRAPALREVSARDSTVAPHRSGDAYHGSYNDYLWSLAMADGNIPELRVDGPDRGVTDPTSPDTESDRDGDIEEDRGPRAR